jgi:hypothetical protein
MTVFYKTRCAPFAHHQRMKKALLILTFPLWMAGSWRLDDRGTGSDAGALRGRAACAERCVSLVI